MGKISLYQKLKDFDMASKVAIAIQRGHYRRIKVGDRVTNYRGYKDNNGRAFVIGDNRKDIFNPDCFFIDGCPMKEVKRKKKENAETTC